MNIALGVQPLQLQLPDPNAGMNALMRAMQIKNAMGEDDLNRLKMKEQQRGLDETNALNEAYSGALGADGAVDRNKLYTILAQRNLGSKIPGVQKTFMEADAKQADIGKTKAETTAKDVETAHKRMDGFGQAMGFVYRDPTPQNAQAAVQHLVTLGVIPPEQAQAALAPLAQNPTPEGIRQWAQLGYRAALSAKDQLPKIETHNIGGTTPTIGVDPVSGKTTTLNVLQNTQSPDNAATNATSVENNKRTVGASLANAAATREVAQATRDAANIQTGFTNEQNLRKEFEGLPEVKNYKQAYPAYAAIKDAATRNTTQSDINIVYGLAKLYDPTSVVREGEYATVANSPNIPERVKGYAQYLQGGGKLSPETKQQILAEAQGRIGTYETEARKAKGSYEQIAKTRGMNPGAVFADMGDMTANPPPPKPAGRAVKRTGTAPDGRKVVEYTDGTIDYAR